ncbi:hypothetical protein [Spongiibacter marinus]|uniref:hypothetical protein n=1 Tax=Spongiibacter marinus TaxID=354246 RepID=UPI0019600848|nr:hypothetical protein [Spongiibacter marinus]MBM7424944.1 hypothetical protein [Spongiibacter marinus]
MKPIAVYRGTTNDDGKFVGPIQHPGKRRYRYRVDLWIKTGNSALLRDEISTKEPVRLNDLLQDQVLPNIDSLIAEADQEGGTQQYGFEIYKWG